jgi:hypothetical protein
MNFYLGVKFVSRPSGGTLFEEVKDQGADDSIGRKREKVREGQRNYIMRSFIACNFRMLLS